MLGGDNEVHRKIVALCLSVLVIMSLVSTTAFAANIADKGTNSTNMARWMNVSTINLSMLYSGSGVSWSGKISANLGTTKIAATYKLYKKNANGTYSLVNTWASNANSDILISTGSAISSKGTYRLTVNATVNTNGIKESISDSLEKTFS